MEILIQTLRPVAGYVPDTGVDISGNTYLEYAISDAASFSFTIPNTYVVGEDMTLVFNESSASSSKAHKWGITVTVATSFTATYTGAYTCSATGGTVSPRSITISTAGAVGGHALAAGMLVSITITRVAADSNEDSAVIRVYTVNVTTITTRYPSTTCLGRVGATVSKVLGLFNDDQQKFLKQADIVGWINEAIYEIAVLGYWHKQTLISVVAGQDSYVLSTLIPDIERVESARWHEPVDLTYRDEMMTIGTWGDYQRALKRYPSSSRASAYHLVGDTLYLVPVPDRNLADGLAVFHSYCPAAVACTSSYDLPVPKAHDDLFVWYALMQGYARDRHSPMASQNQQLYGGLFGKALSRLILLMGTPGMRLRTNR